MYHVLGAPIARSSYPALFVRPTAFVAQVKWLRRNDYHTVTLTQPLDFWTGKGSLPVKPVVLSFDDGYRSDWAVAAPVLARYNYVGVLNLKVDNILPNGGLTTAQVDSLIGRGWELAAHTIHHPDLTTLGPQRLKREVVGSRHDLEARFQVPVNFFCYPSGRFDKTVVAAVRAAGYLGATTTSEGLATHTESPFELARVRVSGGESLTRFAALLRSR
jgi:peptidoglycan/xylan/chitin deacetylase (PgdA/CDA1 family)